MINSFVEEKIKIAWGKRIYMLEYHLTKSSPNISNALIIQFAFFSYIDIEAD